MIYYIVFVLSTKINNIESTEENNLFLYDNTSFSSDREQRMAFTNKKFTSRENRLSPYKRSNDVTQLEKNDEECNLSSESTDNNNLVSYWTSFLSDKEQRMAITTKKFTSRENRLSPYKRSNDVTQLQKNDEECNLLLESIDNNDFVTNDSYLETSTENNDQSNVESDRAFDSITTQSILTIEQEKEENSFCRLKSELKEYIENYNSFSSDQINEYINSIAFDKRNYRNLSKSRTYIENYNKEIKVIVETFIPSFLNFLETYDIDLFTKNYVKEGLVYLQDGLKYLYRFFYNEKVTMWNKHSILITYVQLDLKTTNYFKVFAFEKILLNIMEKIYVIEENKEGESKLKKEMQTLKDQISRMFCRFDTYIENIRRCIERLKFKKR